MGGSWGFLSDVNQTHTQTHTHRQQLLFCLRSHMFKTYAAYAKKKQTKNPAQSTITTEEQDYLYMFCFYSVYLQPHLILK